MKWSNITATIFKELRGIFRDKKALKTVKDNKLKIKVIGVSTFKEALEELSKA